MARPRGQFDYQKQRLLDLVLSLSKNGVCYARNCFLAFVLGLSKRHISRLLSALVKEGKLQRHEHKYFREGYKTLRFLYEKKRWAKPMHRTPPASENRYEAAETVTEEAPAPEPVKVAFGKPDHECLNMKSEVHHGVDFEVPKDNVPKGPSVSDVVAELQRKLAEDEARDAATAAAEAADPVLRMKRQTYRARLLDKVESIKLDVSHRVPKEST